MTYETMQHTWLLKYPSIQPGSEIYILYPYSFFSMEEKKKNAWRLSYSSLMDAFVWKSAKILEIVKDGIALEVDGLYGRYFFPCFVLGKTCSTVVKFGDKEIDIKEFKYFYPQLVQHALTIPKKGSLLVEINGHSFDLMLSNIPGSTISLHYLIDNKSLL